jgi:hypothetical protein
VNTANNTSASGVYTLKAECPVFAKEGVAFFLSITMQGYSINILKE